jgi:hypothetical protein
MKNFFSTAAAVAALTVGATPALAANATQNATATARIVKPLTLTSTQNLDLGTITLSESGSATVGIAQNGDFACGASLTCTGLHQVAKYRVTGVNNQQVTVTAGDVTMLNQADNTKTLLLDVDAPSAVTISNSSVVGAAAGTEFPIGGSVTVNGATVDGTYVGTFAVTVNY